MYDGSSSDCLAFEANDLYKWLEDGLMADGLGIFAGIRSATSAK